MTARTKASIPVRMRVDDTAGRNVEIDRDILRRSYIALLALGREVFAQYRPIEQSAGTALSMSFTEPGPGEVVFELDVFKDSHLRGGKHPQNPGLDIIGPADCPDRALQLTAQTLLEIVRTYAFVLAARTVIREIRPDHVDLTDADTELRLRVSRYVDYGICHSIFADHVREFLMALTRDGVGSISLSSGGRLQRSQIQHVAIANDTTLAFLRGADIARPLEAEEAVLTLRPAEDTAPRPTSSGAV